MDPRGVFSRTLSGVMHIEDVLIHIHMNMEEYDQVKITKYWEKVLIEDDSKLEPKYQSIPEKTLDVWNNFLDLIYEDEWVKYVLIIIHDKFTWLDVPHIINKEEIRVVTSL